MAPRRPHRRELHGEVIEDSYAWMADRDDPAVVAHLQAENDHAEAVLAPLEPLRDQLFDELRARVREDDTTVAVPLDDWEYYSRTVSGQAYPLACRRPRAGGDEQVLLDQNALSEGHDHLAVGDTAVSPDHRLLAYTVDTDGSERYELRIRDLATGDDLPDVIELVTYGLAWASDSSTVLYASPDEAQRPWQIWRHRLGDEPRLDQLVVEEPDERFWLGLWRSRDRRWLVISSDSRTTSEVRLVPADEPGATPIVVEPRSEGLEYAVEPAGDELVVLTNDGAPDFRVACTSIDRPGRAHWGELVAAEAGTRWDDVDALADHVVVHGRRRAAPVTVVVDRRTGEYHELDHGDGDVVEVSPSPVLEYDTSVYRLEVESPARPRTWVEVGLDRPDQRRELRQVEALGVDLTSVVTERRWATAGDGVEIPISVTRHRDTPVDGTAPLVLRAYGAYEMSHPVGFSHSAMSLIERGVVLAVAHVRGGGELGRDWWEQGRLANKPNTFGDVVAVAEHLVATGHGHPDRLALWGGSAGGLLVGAVLNARPELFCAVVAAVPFVDVVNTMLDDSLPLTVTEWEEWGDPRVEADYRVIRSYAPYENVGAVDHPAMLVLAGWNDPRVAYWEPAKWVAAIRHRSTGGGPILLRTEFDSGHAGPSGRYETWREACLVHAFLLWRLGVASLD